MLSARIILKEFKSLHPDLWTRGSMCTICGYMTAEIRIPTKGIILYNIETDTITWLERWVDEKEVKRKEKEKRPKNYIYFCFVISEYLKKHRMTQQEFADMVGISRRSLSKYLNGNAIPKSSTMRNILNQINIDI